MKIYILVSLIFLTFSNDNNIAKKEFTQIPNITGNWQLFKMNPPKDNLISGYHEMFIDSTTINYISEIGLFRVDNYSIKDCNSITIDGKITDITVLMQNDTLIFFRGSKILTKYIRIKKGFTPQDYLSKKMNQKYFEDFYKREEIFLKSHKNN